MGSKRWAAAVAIAAIQVGASRGIELKCGAADSLNATFLEGICGANCQEERIVNEVSAQKVHENRVCQTVKVKHRFRRFF